MSNFKCSFNLMFGKLHVFLKEAFRSEFSPFFRYLSRATSVYTELAQNKADIVFAAR